MDARARIQLEKILCYVLRHCPEDFGVELDDDGFGSIENVCKGMDVSRKEMEEIVALSDKKRFEIRDDKVRALYGHSFQKQIPKKEVIPPEFLYHGTTCEAKKTILTQGIKPMSRQYVHLSKDTETAEEVGKRRTENPVILVINAQKAYQDGVKFYEGNENTILADSIPPEYVLN